MEVNIKQAQKIFFSKSSFEMIYFEAFANALDAGASLFEIKIEIPQQSQLQNITLELSDNGEGFNDMRFSKFGKLFDVEERSHKGLGRLVYLCYFDKVKVSSTFDGHYHREFIFDEFFSNKNTITEVKDCSNGTQLKLSSFNGQKLGKNEYISPKYIKRVLLENFYMKFYKAKSQGFPITVNISCSVGGRKESESITSLDLPNFYVLPLDNRVDLYNKIDLYYHIAKVEIGKENVITALAIDDRTMKVDLIDAENILPGYEMIFLLISESFNGVSNESRTSLDIDEPNLNSIKMYFREAVSVAIRKEIPKVAKENDKRINSLKETFPHLDGYFDITDIGYLSKMAVLKKAQDKFFRDQNEILCARELSDEQFEKSLNLSARALAEYIIFRQNVISKMRSFSGKNRESDLHNLLAPKNSSFKQGELIKDLYRNNVWVIDDKFMSYCTVLSETEMAKVIDYITDGETKDDDDDRPDITLFFSQDPTEKGKMVDVVIVELKRLGISAEQNSIVEFQLDTRTQKLADYYQKHIQRMWFYGIVDFDEKYETHLVNQGFNPLFSSGNVYFRSKTIYTDKTKSFGVIQNAYIMDYRALIEDANSRNETFLDILRHHFNNSQNN